MPRSPRKAWRCTMAACKDKRVKCKGTPGTGIRVGGAPSGGIRVGGDPGSIMGLSPSWRLASCDEGSRWAFSEERVGPVLWTSIFPKLRQFESMTWNEIMLEAKKQNHSIELWKLNKDARDRLAELEIEAEALYSLRLGGRVRIYGYLEGAVYHILWYDDDHGGNDTCVCRSEKKHT